MSRHTWKDLFPGRQARPRSSACSCSAQFRDQRACGIDGGLISELSAPPVTLTLVHAGKEPDVNALELPQKADWSWNQLFGKGDPVEWILAAGAEFDVDLIVMATKGQDSLLEMLRGSTTERVLRGARCPLLAIPAKLI